MDEILYSRAQSRHYINGQALKLYRNNILGLSMRDFGKLVGVSTSYVNILESRGEHPVSPETAARLQQIMHSFGGTSANVN